jgi:hypothetical protein
MLLAAAEMENLNLAMVFRLLVAQLRLPIDRVGVLRSQQCNLPHKT